MKNVKPLIVQHVNLSVVQNVWKVILSLLIQPVEKVIRAVWLVKLTVSNAQKSIRVKLVKPVIN